MVSYSEVNLTLFEVLGEKAKFPPSNLKWNAPAEGAGSVKEYLDSSSNHRVRVARTVIDKYGSVQYDIRFVNNKGITPPGAGFVPLLQVNQSVATDGVEYPPLVYETQRGSEGLSGTFDINLHDTFNGPKQVYFDESPERLQKKLEQLATVSQVFVEKFQFPSNVSGGFGDVPVVDGTLGGFEYRIFFTKNTGLVNGYSFPPGSGNIEPLETNFTAQQSLFGTSVIVDTVNYVQGSAPIDGSFNITYNNTFVGTIPYDQQAIEIKYMMEGSGLFGQVTTSSLDRFMGRVPGVFVSVARDSNYLTIEYDHPNQYTDIRGMIAAGDSFRIGGNLYPNSDDSFDGSPFLSQMEVAPQDPVFRPVSALDRLVVPGDNLRIGADAYKVLRTGEEIQVVSVNCDKRTLGQTAPCGNFNIRIFYDANTWDSTCISRSQNGDMTSAAAIKQSFVDLNQDFSGLVITKLDSDDKTSYAYLIYYESDKLKGDMKEIVVIHNSGCSLIPDTTISISTQNQGGSISIQTVRTNVDSGYIEGGLYQLKYDQNITECISYGADATVVQSKLMKLTELTDIRLPFDVSVDPASPFALIASSSVFGILNINDKINIPDTVNQVDRIYTITQIVSGLKFYVKPNPDHTISSNSAVYLRDFEAIQVARHGTGNSTSPTLTVTQTGDEYVNPESKGFFKIKLNINGQEKISSTCLRYHATAEQFQDAINSMQFDFNNDQTFNSLDYDHVRVHRDGDGTQASGYGYVYTLDFVGPALTFGSSLVLGDSQPYLSIIDKGHMGGCFDLNSTYINSFFISYNLSVDSLTWTSAISDIQNTRQRLTGLVQAGDRVIVPGSIRPYFLYDVVSVSDTTITVNEVLPPASAQGINAYNHMEVRVVKAPFPEFTVETVQQGEDSYTYDIYFTGQRLTDVMPLSIQACSSKPQHFGGMLYGLEVIIQEDSGSPVEQSIVISSLTPVINQMMGYFKIIYLGQYVISSSIPGINGIQWGIGSTELQFAISTELGMDVKVVRTGAGSPEENYGYQYKISFPYVNSLNENFPEMSVATDKQASRPYFMPGDFTAVSQLNDLVVSGTFNATDDYTFIVRIQSKTNSSNGFSWEMTTVGGVTSIINGTAIQTIVSGKSYPLAHGIRISFGSKSGHNIDDSWFFTAVRTDSPLPLLGSVIANDNVLPTGSSSTEIVVSPGFQGTANSIVSVYQMSPMFTVADQSSLVYTLTTTDPVSTSTFSYRIQRKSNSSFVNNINTFTNSSCLAWNAMDYEVEQSLQNQYIDICQPNTLSSCLTVTRSINKFASVLSYIYTIYIDTALFIEPTAPQDEMLFINTTDSTCTPAPPANKLSLELSSYGSIHIPFTKYQIPLALLENSTIEAFYRSTDLNHVPIYKLNGNSWSIRYDSNLGDLPPIEITPTETLSNGTSLIVIDNVVQGDNPQNRILYNVATGLEHYVRLQAYTRGPFHGYGNFTQSESAIPSGTPPPVDGLSAVETLQVFEEQDIYIGASHLIEIQSVTTSAPAYSEIQEINIRAPQGSEVDGNYTLRFPAIQSLQIRSPTDGSYTGYFSIGYTKLTLSSQSKNPTTDYTTCLNVKTASDIDVKKALEALPSVDSVNVVRSSFGGYTSYFGYEYQISFVGNEVAGSVQPLTVQYGLSSSSCSGPFPPSVSAIVSRVNPDQAVGLDTEIQTVTVAAAHYIEQGQFKLTFDNVATGCINWNASGAEMGAALKSIATIDDVYVERYGDGKFTNGDFGYSFNVFFTGNMLHLRSNTAGATFPTFNVELDTCGDTKKFSYVKNGVLTNFVNSEYNVTITSFQTRNYSVQSYASTADDLLIAFTKLPQFVQVYDIRNSLLDSRRGHMFTITFDLSMKNAPSLACGTDSVFQTSNSVCSQNTIIDGNQIGGYFTLDNSRSLPYDISASALQYELQTLTSFGNVSVTRTEEVSPGGYTWTIMWLSATGDQPTLRTTNSLTGSGAKIKVQTIQNGNYLGGYYQLGYNNAKTTNIPFNASPEVIAGALLPIVGRVRVEPVSPVSTEGGGVMRVTFTDLTGDVALLTPYYNNNTLTGVNAVVSVFEVVKGTRAQGNMLKLSYQAPIHCSFSEVEIGNCGAPVDYYNLDVGTAGTYTNVTYTIVPSYDIQIVRVAAPSLASEVYFTQEDATGYFKLGYNGHYTAPISSHATETAMRDALERLPDVDTVAVRRSLSVMPIDGATVRANPGDYSLTCDSVCHFERLREGDVIRVHDLWFKVGRGFVFVDASLPTIVPLAYFNDSSILTFYNGPPISNEPIYIWSRGYEYEVHFLSVKTKNSVGQPLFLPMDSTKHGLNPYDATVSIRHADCNGCFDIPKLTVWRQYFIRLRGHNINGLGNYAVTTGTPKEVPGPPSDVSLKIITGTKLRLIFSPPAGFNSDILAYIVQWDTSDQFSHIYSSGGGGGGASCSSVGYGQCTVTGAAIAFSPPYDYLIEGLSIHTLYYARVSAINSVSPRMDQFPTENVKWSQVVNAITDNQAPSIPQGPTIITSGLTSLQLFFVPPLFDGGVPITNYTIVWDSSPNFNNKATLGSITVPDSSLETLNVKTNQRIYDIRNLVTGVFYWVSVTARNAIGQSLTAVTLQSAQPGGKASAPSAAVVSTLRASDNKITTATLTWSPPYGLHADGGVPITGYLIEWWTSRSIPDVQLVQYRSRTYPSAQLGVFSLTFSNSPAKLEQTNNMPWTVSPYDLRSELLNMGYRDLNTTGGSLLGDIAVDKSIILKKGYQWRVEFDSTKNQGDQPLLGARLAGVSSNDFVKVVKLTNGQRTGGFHEVQLLTVTLQNSNDISDLTGWLRLSFKGFTHWSPWFRITVSNSDMQNAINEINTIRPVTVTRSLVNGTSFVGYQWRIQFSGDFGDQPALVVDGVNIRSKNPVARQVVVSLDDGDNSLSVTGYKASNALPGEYPADYRTHIAASTDNKYILTDLSPGVNYTVAVSAINAFGVGSSLTASPTLLSPPQQIPQPPTGVSVDVHYGSSTSLDITYGPPSNDGGADVLSYRVEIDTTSKFLNPIATIIPCPTANTRSIFEIITSSTNPQDPIVTGYFQLDLQFNGKSFTTDPIPYDAVATSAEELGVILRRGSLFGNVTGGSDTVIASGDVTGKFFPGDRLQFDLQVDSKAVYTIKSTNGTEIIVDQPIDSTQGKTPTLASMWRLLGGIGTNSDSRVACDIDTTNALLCPPSRLQFSGSIQSKFEIIPNALLRGVKVDRDDPDTTNGVHWRVTFLDDAEIGNLDFQVSVNNNAIQTSKGNFANITVNPLQIGQVFESCIGTHEIPTDKTLTKGLLYYARVFALNQVGYSLAGNAPKPQKPMVVPGAPTSVVLAVQSATALRVSWNPPADDGGDTITLYRVDYSLTSSFAVHSSVNVTYLAGSSNYFKTVTGLTTGTFYFIRVLAYNSQGFGPAAISTPSSLNPYTKSDGPTNVILKVTSDTMLTVSWNPPLNNGGDNITTYRVEWDVTISFNSAVPAPNKGFVDLDAALFSSYTIQSLTGTTVYYVQVYAKNNAGLGLVATASVPSSAVPSFEVPGRPHTIQAVSGNGVGYITVTWQRPRIPWHNIPCAGTLVNPSECPSSVGGGLPASDGGQPITTYVVAYNEKPDFSGIDTGELVTSGTSYTIQNLIPGRKYYIRVLGRNAQGSGPYCQYQEVNCGPGSKNLVAAIATTVFNP